MLENYSDLNLWNDLFAWLGRPNCKATRVLHSNADKGFNVDEQKAVNCK
jgi:hypothetical protein